MADRFGSERILASIDAALATFPGDLGFYAKNLETGEEVGHRAGVVMPTASVIKVGIMAELYRQAEAGEIDLAERQTVTAEDRYGGTGVLKEFEPGVQPTLTDLCRMMIVVSDNVATGMLVRLLGKDRINQSFDDWGLPQTKLVWNFKYSDDSRKYAVSTARDLGRLMELIATDGFLSPTSTAAMRHHLSRQQHLEQIGRYIPYNPYASEIKREQSVSLMNKIGNDKGVRADAAIVVAPGARFVIVSMNEGSHQHHFRVDQEGNILNGRIAKAVFDAWVPEGAVPDEW